MLFSRTSKQPHAGKKTTKDSPSTLLLCWLAAPKTYEDGAATSAGQALRTQGLTPRSTVIAQVSWQLTTVAPSFDSQRIPNSCSPLKSRRRTARKMHEYQRSRHCPRRTDETAQRGSMRFQESRQPSRSSMSSHRQRRPSGIILQTPTRILGRCCGTPSGAQPSRHEVGPRPRSSLSSSTFSLPERPQKTPSTHG